MIFQWNSTRFITLILVLVNSIMLLIVLDKNPKSSRYDNDEHQALFSLMSIGVIEWHDWLRVHGFILTHKIWVLFWLLSHMSEYSLIHVLLKYSWSIFCIVYSLVLIDISIVVMRSSRLTEIHLRPIQILA